MTPPTHSLRFQSSSIEGQGGFALADLPKDTHVIEYIGEKVDKTESARRCAEGNHFIFDLDEEFDLDGNVSWNPARLLNHSCTPNCEAEMDEGRIWIIARRDIRAGEEITFNYGYDEKDYWEHPCRCGAAECVGYIVAEGWVAPAQPAGANAGLSLPMQHG